MEKPKANSAIVREETKKVQASTWVRLEMQFLENLGISDVQGCQSLFNHKQARLGCTQKARTQRSLTRM